MIPSTTSVAAFVALLLHPASVSSFSFSFNSFFVDSDGSGSVDFVLYPTWNISTECTNAYKERIPCDISLIQPYASTVDKETLDTMCSDTCIDGLRAWRDGIREKCSADDIEIATSKLSEIGYSTFDAEGPMGAVMVASVANKELPVIELLYWANCMQDSNTGDFCLLGDVYNQSTWQFNDTSLNTAEETNTFCGNTCLTQSSAFAYGISGSVYGSEGMAIGDVSVLCPSVDTSNYPFFLSEKPVSSFTFGPFNSTTNGSANSTSSADSATGSSTVESAATTAVNGTDENAAGLVRGSFAGMGSVAIAVAITAFII